MDKYTSMKITVLQFDNCSGDFSPQVIGRSILITSENENKEVHIDKT